MKIERGRERGVVEVNNGLITECVPLFRFDLTGGVAFLLSGAGWHLGDHEFGSFVGWAGG